MNERQERFIALLNQIFEMDKSDLDFGIYRILNIRRAEIQKFFYEKLPNQIKEILKPFDKGNKDEIRQELQKMEQLAASFGTTPENNPKYNELKAQLQQGTDISALESDVYSALYNFFSRYYDEGDFISKRRYKEGVYAIPYEGEEVKLYWANQDQYYIKTSENFKDYTFTAGDYTVHFLLVDATTEQNNNKENDTNKRQFMLFIEDEEQYPGVKTFEYNEEEKIVNIRFVFDIPKDKKIKYQELNATAIKKWLSTQNSNLMIELLRPSNPDAKAKDQISIIEKHLKAYVAKNTFDYFIHKDLNGFLNRELDFFIKNEVMHLDDLDTENEARVETYIAKVRAIKQVGQVIISFLAQIENFQKKLWLKKKFVVDTNWCITLDLIPEEYYDEIRKNKAQIQEWIDLYAINEFDTDLEHTEPFSNVPSILFLKQNQNLIVDTIYFSDEFKVKLIAEYDGLDKKTGGLIVNSDNFQALNLLSSKYNNTINGIYTDPPYNTDASEILYKNGYKSSSWCSLVNDRLIVGKKLLNNDGICCVTIDDFQVHELYYILQTIFGIGSHLGTVTVKSNPQGRSTQTGFQLSHEYALFFRKGTAKVGTLERNENQISRYGESDEKGAFEWRNLRAQYSQESASMIYPIFISNDCSYFRLPKMVWKEDIGSYILKEDPKENEIISWPEDEDGRMRTWKYAIPTLIKMKDDNELGIRKDRRGNPALYYKGRMKSEGMQPYSIWDKPEYSASTFGANILADMIGKGIFSYPKSINAVVDSLRIISSSPDATYLDFFGGSGTTAHAVITLNRNYHGNRKYILVEMGGYFRTATLNRTKKAIYCTDSKKWKKGKPLARNTGNSHIMKYLRLEQYEDALSNIELNKNDGLASLFGDDYMINYMLDMEAKGSLLNLDAFKTPFSYEMNITEKNETKAHKVDLCETFNYLIGLTVQHQGIIRSYDSHQAADPVYEGAVDLVKGTQFAFRQIEGLLPDGRKALIIWRTINEDLQACNAALDAYFAKYRINPLDREYDVIYVNGDNNLENLRTSSETWKVVLIEQEFKKRMFEEE